MLSKLWPVLPVENDPLERFKQFLISLAKQANTIFHSRPHHLPTAALGCLTRPHTRGAGPGICFWQSDMKISRIHVKTSQVQDSWCPLPNCCWEFQISNGFHNLLIPASVLLSPFTFFTIYFLPCWGMSAGSWIPSAAGIGPKAPFLQQK